LLSAIRRGDHRRLRDNEMTNDLLGLIGQVPIDALSPSVWLDDDHKPLAPSAFWFGTPSSLPELVSEVERTIVSLTISDGHESRRGSGVVLDGGGRIATAAHLIAGQTTVVGRCFDGTEFDATVAEVSPTTDLAVLRPLGEDELQVGEPLPVATAESVIQPGDQVFTLGYPEAGPGRAVAAWGLVGRTSRRIRLRDAPAGIGAIDVMEVTCKSSPGSSGSPVFDMDLNLVGIVTGGGVRHDADQSGDEVTHVIPARELEDLTTSTRVPAAGTARPQPQARGTRPTEFLNDMTTVPRGTPMLRQHWRNPDDEQLVDVVIPEPHRFEGQSARLESIGRARFLEPLRVFVHRVELTRAVEPDLLSSIQPGHSPVNPPREEPIDLPTFEPPA
jgi:hypothetical protein